MNLTGNHEFECSIPVLAQWVKDPALLWPWCRLVASASITPLDWEPAHASHVALERQKDKKNKQKKKTKKPGSSHHGTVVNESK